MLQFRKCKVQTYQGITRSWWSIFWNEIRSFTCSKQGQISLSNVYCSINKKKSSLIVSQISVTQNVFSSSNEHIFKVFHLCLRPWLKTHILKEERKNKTVIAIRLIYSFQIIPFIPLYHNIRVCVSVWSRIKKYIVLSRLHLWDILKKPTNKKLGAKTKHHSILKL